jgi:hypothetical protein
VEVEPRATGWRVGGSGWGAFESRHKDEARDRTPARTRVHARERLRASLSLSALLGVCECECGCENECECECGQEGTTRAVVDSADSEAVVGWTIK